VGVTIRVRRVDACQVNGNADFTLLQVLSVEVKRSVEPVETAVHFPEEMLHRKLKASVMDGAVIGTECIIGAYALVLKGTQIAPRSLVLGSPARLIRELTAGEVAGIYMLAQKYVGVARRYREGGAGSKPS
jgi:hypothetical protein